MIAILTRAVLTPPAGRPLPFRAPWRDRTGRVSPLRIATLLLLVAPATWVALCGAFDALGPEPAKAALREIGLWSVRLLLVALAVTPAARLLALPVIATLRRMVGLGALAYAAVHLVLYVVHENYRLGHVAAEILLRFYLTIGMVALLGLVALGWTSTDGWMRRLRGGWKRLHRLVFPITALAVFHYVLQSKSALFEAVIAAGILAWMLLWRALPKAWQARPLVLAALAVGAALATAGLEYAWYALGTNLPAARILAANLDLEAGLRPAVWVGLGALVLPLLARWRTAR